MFTSRVAACLYFAATLLPLCVIAPGAFAVEPTTTMISPVATLGKLAVALIVVLIVFWIFARIMRQVQGFQGGMHRRLKIVGALSVGQRERVVVVQAGDQQLVLGITATQINTLHVLDKPLGYETDSRKEPSTAQGDFKTKLSAALSRQVKS